MHITKQYKLRTVVSSHILWLTMFLSGFLILKVFGYQVTTEQRTINLTADKVPNGGKKPRWTNPLAVDNISNSVQYINRWTIYQTVDNISIGGQYIKQWTIYQTVYNISIGGQYIKRWKIYQTVDNIPNGGNKYLTTDNRPNGG